MSIFGATRDHHARLDQLVLQPLLVADLTPDHYRAHLIRIYGFEAPLDAALAYTPQLATVYEPRPRTGLLVRDLLFLDMRPAQIATLPQCGIEPFASVGQALGWAYVLERSRLHQPMVSARVVERLPDVSCEYLCRDEIGVAARWDEFAASLQRYAGTSGDRDVLVDGAVSAFAWAIDWFASASQRVER